MAMNKSTDWQAFSVELAMEAKKNLDAKDDKIDRLRAQLKETEEKGRVLMDMCRDLRARVAELEVAILNAVQAMPGGQAKAELRDVYDAETPTTGGIM